LVLILIAARHWKIELIERFNPGWRDLTGELV
jgi:predicted GIY-YIG superfamily endonuclease